MVLSRDFHLFPGLKWLQSWLTMLQPGIRFKSRTNIRQQFAR